MVEKKTEKKVAKTAGEKLEKKALKKAEKKPVEKTGEKVEEATKRMKRKAKPARRPFSRLYAKALFTGYKRGLRNQHENTALLTIEGCKKKEDAWFYVGKKAAFVYKGKRYRASLGDKTKKSRIRAIWGKVTRPHGGSGAVRAIFKSNLPCYAMGRRVRIMLYPSNI
uniref:Large ribosomal subunit protein eL33 n=1 Tax=Megafenestra aurita TaxID=2291010 RepID=A0A4Y7NHR6_9CRUS|nr:EOG090X0IZN [Megafenestra aurita]SVE92770.1 EOG090X0IZN [Megafenestra aurita]